MFVAASTDCFPDLSLDAALDKVVELEFARVEFAVREHGNQLKPSQVLANLDKAVQACRETHRLKPVALFVDIDAPRNAYYQQFAACCRLAKATGIVSVTVPAGVLGTPFNEEIERLRELVRIGADESVLVSVNTEIGHMTEDPATAVVLCDNVKGLGITLDPSHYTCGPHAGANYEHLIKHTYHVRLRDTSKDKLQVRVGQGQIEYGRLINQLNKANYQRGLAVHIVPQEGVDHLAEMRKLRLLLESLL
ncbi:MAG: sugar phosphate isomerase/epimerase [Pirellulales bacterium]|nr:sugar phosphate isomerase/epimerase [Pirellulales bacterium]